jgi:hypothetical protein
MSSVAGLVDTAVRAAGIPIDGVSIGVVANRATWVCHFQAAATPAQQAQAQTILDTVVVDAPTQSDATAIEEVDLKVLRAVSVALWECIPSPLLTKPQLRARAIAIWKSL